MSLSPKQSAIVTELTRRGPEGTMTLDEITALVGRNVYHNAQKHTGALVSNMVRRGYLIRVKPGTFKLTAVRAAVTDFPDHLKDWATKHGLILVTTTKGGAA